MALGGKVVPLLLIVFVSGSVGAASRGSTPWEMGICGLSSGGKYEELWEQDGTEEGAKQGYGFR